MKHLHRPLSVALSLTLSLAPRLMLMLCCVAVLVLPAFAHAGGRPAEPFSIAMVGPLHHTAALTVTQVPTPAELPDAGTDTLAGPDFTQDLALFAADPSNPEAWGKLLLHAIMKGQWGLLVSLLLTVLIAGLRKWVPESSKLGLWFRSKVGAITTNVGLSLGLGFVSTLASGEPFSVALVLKALTIAFTAAGTWSVFKALSEAKAESAAKAAGVAAAADPGNTLDK